MAITQYDENGRVVARYSSPREAYRLTGIRSNDIQRVLEGKRQTAGGYVFRETKRLTPTHGEDHIRVFTDDGIFVAMALNRELLRETLRPDLNLQRLTIRDLNGSELYRLAVYK